MVREIAAQKDESVRVCRGSYEPAQVPDRVTWCVEEVEGAIAEVVYGWDFAEMGGFGGVGEVEFS